MADLICPSTGNRLYQIESLRELDAITAITCWGWDSRLRDMARSTDPIIQSTLNCQTDWTGNKVARLPCFSNPQNSDDLRALWSIQNQVQIALIPINGAIAWASISIQWIQSPESFDKPFEIWPHPCGTQVGATQAIAICLGAIACHGQLFDLKHQPTELILLPEILRSSHTKIA